MCSNKTFINKKILIYGMGLSGNSCLKYLSKYNKVKIFDDDKIISKNNKHFINIKEIFHLSFDFIVLSPGIDFRKCKLSNFLIKNKNRIITELDIFFLIFPENTKITITGTNGKSTSCKLLYNIFKSENHDIRLVGNIGNPPLLEKKITKKTIFIIEASSYQISYCKYFKTDYAAIINLSADHLERHGSINNYAKAKLKLIFDQHHNKYSFIEKSNSYLNKFLINKIVKSKIKKISYNKFVFFKKKITNNYLLDINNLKNIHFIYQISKCFRISDKKIFFILNKFKGLEFRKQIIYNKKGLTIINDSKSTSFSSTNGLLSSYKNIYWIVGGMFKKGDKFYLHKKYFKNVKAYVIGLNRKYYVNQFKNKIKHKYLKTLKKAILEIRKDMKNDYQNKIILFSPAAASFDQFKDFQDRGKIFNNEIRNVKFND